MTPKLIKRQRRKKVERNYDKHIRKIHDMKKALGDITTVTMYNLDITSLCLDNLGDSLNTIVTSLPTDVQRRMAPLFKEMRAKYITKAEEIRKRYPTLKF
jgi:hypothetical protein